MASFIEDDSPYVMEDIELDYSQEMEYKYDHLHPDMLLFDFYWEEMKTHIQHQIFCKSSS